MVSGMAFVVRLCVLFRQVRDGKRCPTVVGRYEFSDAEMAGCLMLVRWIGALLECVVAGSVQQLHVCIISALCFLSA